jgi:hypothetical protein
MNPNLLKTFKVTMAIAGVMLAGINTSSAQVGIGTKIPDASAMLDVFANDKGILFPRVALVNDGDPNTVPTPATGITVWNTNENMVGGSGIGLYSNFGLIDKPNWLKLVNSQDLPTGGAGWLLTGNVVNANDYLGTNNAFPLVIKTANTEAMRIDQNQLVGIGIQPMVGTRVNISGRVNSDDSYDIDGGRFVWNGGFSVKRNTFLGVTSSTAVTGTNNTFTGFLAGSSTTTGSNNVFMGANSGDANTIGNSNTFLGASSGLVNLGSNNTFVGQNSGKDNTFGSGNTFIGVNTTSSSPFIQNSTAIGIGAKTKIANEIQLGNDMAKVSIGPNPSGAAATLDVDGTTIIGTNGTIIKNIITKSKFEVSFGSDIEGFSSIHKTFNVPNAVVGSTVHVSPEFDFLDGIVIAYARVSAPGVVKVIFTNTKPVPVFPPGEGGGQGASQFISITVIEPITQ